MNRNALFVAACLVIMSLAGCAAPAAQPQASPAPPTQALPELAAPTPTNPPAAQATLPAAPQTQDRSQLKSTLSLLEGMDADSAAAAERAVNALAKRLNLAPEAVKVVSAGWSEIPPLDTGCPDFKGEAVPRVSVQGLVIILEAEGSQYTYHSDGRKLVLCR